MTKVVTFVNTEDQFTLSYSHMFAYPENQTTFFAFTFPFSYQESIEQMDELQEKLIN